MKTFLPQNQFNSASPVADDAAASSPAPAPDAAAALSNAIPFQGASGTEVAGSVRTAASDLDQLAIYLRTHDSRFVPDKVAIWDAMHDPNAPRVRADDPVWADDPPLFLKSIG